MGYQSLVALGSNHPQTLSGANLPGAITRPTQSFPAGAPLPEPVGVESYLGPVSKRQPLRGYLRSVRLFPGLIPMHKSWMSTALADAINRSGVLDLHKITPEMMRGMTVNDRQILMELLSTVRQRVVWVDEQGRKFNRRRWLRIPLGRHYHVNSATALAMRMALTDDRLAYREALRDGLTVVVDEFQGTKAGKRFSAGDVAFVVISTIEKALTCDNPAVCSATLAACGTLVSHYMQEHAFGRAAAMREGMQQLLQVLGAKLRREPAHVGLALGLVMAGGLKHAGIVSDKDFRRRWSVASGSNLTWAASSFLPVPWASGLAATVVVAASILWDRAHPSREYGDVVQRFSSEVMLLGKTGKMGFTPAEVADMRGWTEVALEANGSK